MHHGVAATGAAVSRGTVEDLATGWLVTGAQQGAHTTPVAAPALSKGTTITLVKTTAAGAALDAGVAHATHSTSGTTTTVALHSGAPCHRMGVPGECTWCLCLYQCTQRTHPTAATAHTTRYNRTMSCRILKAMLPVPQTHLILPHSSRQRTLQLSVHTQLQLQMAPSLSGNTAQHNQMTPHMHSRRL